MTKLLLVFLLAVAVVFAQAGGGTVGPGPGGHAKSSKVGKSKIADKSGTGNTTKGGQKKPGGSFSIPCYSWQSPHAGVPKPPAGSGGTSKVGKVDINEVKVGGKKGVNKAGKQPPAKRPESAPPAK